MTISYREGLLWWSQNGNEFIVEQDEELYLAGLGIVPDILHVLDSPVALPEKKLILLEALFVMVYDQQEEREVLLALKERSSLVERCSPHLPQYLTEVVLPKLDRTTLP